MSEIVLPLVGVLIGAGVSLATIYLQNRESKKAREFDLKKQAFVEVAESIVQANQLIMQIPSLAFDELDRRFSATNIGSSITKLNLTASAPIVKVVSEYQSLFLERWLNLLLEKHPMETHITDLGITQAFLKDQSKRFDDIIAKLGTIPVADKATYQSNLNLLDGVKKRLDELYSEQEKLLNLREKERLRLMKLCMQALIELSKPLNTAMILVRKELELVTDEEEFLTIANTSSDKNQKTFNNFLEKVEELQKELATKPVEKNV